MIEVVAGLILDETGRLLACRRPEGKHLGGKWEFPGGKLEEGEDAATALVRELEEELGVTVQTGESLTPVIWDYGKGPIRLHPILCRIAKGEPHPHEHSEICWCDLEELTLLDWAAADLPILEEWRALLQACPDVGQLLEKKLRPQLSPVERIRELVLELIGAHEQGGQASAYLRQNVPGIEDGTFFDLPDHRKLEALQWLSAAYFGRGEAANELLETGALRPDFPGEFSAALKALGP
ncbi:(deoxy)nucleoside triphosphate pyrophosphohydrolase [Haloferula sp. BvORR071]|uniref:(deoxy)nucleoside triphosphate pyrophosphohydrolase n=1 Tax=Haloferula sp. BvORR071 TaxID=1396141 RepID=UPI0009463073|nr:(deoxy)nucleoside triphosphate pyrophosphohydrolase [Haloferula sp. BvORR071]